MKEIKLYVCGVCGQQYKMKNQAEKCESGHKRIKRIKKSYYHPITVDATGTPASIEVEMTDGSIVKYRK